MSINLDQGREAMRQSATELCPVCNQPLFRGRCFYSPCPENYHAARRKAEQAERERREGEAKP